MNTLYYGDNLDILQRYVKDESVDLIYLDPPFNSNATYNVFLPEKSGGQARAQLQAFKDTWKWAEAAPVYEELMLNPGPMGAAMRAFGELMPRSSMLAYLTMMAPRLAELRRVLKPTGSIYLHCDPTASHYLKVLMDGIFGAVNYRSEITWLRSRNPKGSQHALKRYSPDTDILLYYGRTDLAEFHYDRIKTPLNEGQLKKKYDRMDEQGPFTDGPIICSPSMGNRPNLVYEYKGYTPGAFGWRVSLPKLIEIDKAGNLGWSSSGKPYRKLRPALDSGNPVGNCWTDISSINPQAVERLGYPTQKPEALLDRIIKASSNDGDLVLDPFCGCGTATVAAQRLGRRWVGIDVAQAAIRTIVQRLKDSFGASCQFEVIGEPTTAEDAQALFIQDAYQFQWWATGLVGARPAEQKKGADHGIDGRLYFADDNTAKAKQIVISVKGGGTGVGQVRDLVGVVNREGAAVGVLISMHEPTGPMRAEAAGAGLYESPLGSRHPRVQLLTIEELLGGKGIDYPRQAVNQTWEKAPRERKRGKQSELGIG